MHYLECGKVSAKKLGEKICVFDSRTKIFWQRNNVNCVCIPINSTTTQQRGNHGQWPEANVK